MPEPTSFTASSQNRSLAYLVDLVAASLLFLAVFLVSDALGNQFWGALEFGGVLFAYHLYFLLVKDGISFGKYLRNICVVSANGARLQSSQCVLRAGLIAMPWALLGGNDGLPDVMFFLLPNPGVVLATLGVAWFFGDLMILEFTLTRRTLTDRLARTLVLNLPPLQPHRAPAAPMYSATDAEFGHPPRLPPRQ